MIVPPQGVTGHIGRLGALQDLVRIRAAEIAAWLDERGLESLPGDLEQDPCLWCYTCGVYLGYCEPDDSVDWSGNDG